MYVDRILGRARHFLVLRNQEFKREMHTGQIASGNRQIAWRFGTTGKNYRIEFLAQLFCRYQPFSITGNLARQHCAGDHGTGDKAHTFHTHLRHTPVNQAFVEFEIGDAVTQQAADAITLLEHRDRVSGPCQLLCRSQAGRPGANHGNFLSCLMTRRLRCNPAVLARFVDDGALDGLDANRVLLDVQRTGSFAGCRADATGEFGKIIG